MSSKVREGFLAVDGLRITAFQVAIRGLEASNWDHETVRIDALRCGLLLFRDDGGAVGGAGDGRDPA